MAMATTTAIVCNLPVLMAKRRLNIQDVCDRTGLARTTVSMLYNGKGKAISYGTIEALCRLFDCSVGDLLEYVPEKQNN